MKEHGEKKNMGFEDAVASVRGDQMDPQQSAETAQRAWQRIQTELAADPAAVPRTIRGCADMQAMVPAYRSRQLDARKVLLLEDHVKECADCRHALEKARGSKVVELRWSEPAKLVTPVFDFRRFALAAMVLLTLGAVTLTAWKMFYAPLPGSRATIASADGPVYLMTATGEQRVAPGHVMQEGDVLRTSAGARAMLTLFDGSEVEMNERSEFSMSARPRATRLYLNRGKIIVHAAKQNGGRLYVEAPDAQVAVKGTIFSVNSGIKGTRVSVIEGLVEVQQFSGTQDLQPGEQISTSESVSAVTVEEEISWSANREKHLELLAQFSKLQKNLETLATPPLRYTSEVLPLAPMRTVVYASIPNYGQTLRDANRMFQEQLQQSAVLREWFAQSGPKAGQPTLDEMVGKIHLLSQFVGEEVVLMMATDAVDGRRAHPVIAAKVIRPGLKQFLETEIEQAQQRVAADGDRAIGDVLVVDEATVRANSGSAGKIVVMAGEKFVALSSDWSALQQFTGEGTVSGFSGGGFGQRIAESYQEGAGLLFAADLETILRQQGADTDPRHQLRKEASGIGDVHHLIVKRREQNGVVDNRAMLDFSRERRGVTSWLATPGPMGSLEFISPDAVVAASVTVKQPVQMLDDLRLMMQAGGENPDTLFAEIESKLNLRVREDLAEALGSDYTLALDGQLLPVPSWKLVAEVYDQQRVVYVVQQVVNEINREAAAHNRPGVQMEQEQLDGRMYYKLSGVEGTAPVEIHFTFAHGYLLAGPNRATLAHAMRVKESGNSLVRSAGFRALLPSDSYANVSGLTYQNLGRIAGPLMEQVPFNSNEAQSLQTILANSKPSLICAYGGTDRIELATSSRFFGFDINSVALSQLLSQTVRSRGTQ